MRVRIDFPVDIDPVAYSAAFAIDRSVVRKDVKKRAAMHVRNLLRTYEALIEEDER